MGRYVSFQCKANSTMCGAHVITRAKYVTHSLLLPTFNLDHCTSGRFLCAKTFIRNLQQKSMRFCHILTNSFKLLFGAGLQLTEKERRLAESESFLVGFMEASALFHADLTTKDIKNQNTKRRRRVEWPNGIS